MPESAARTLPLLEAADPMDAPALRWGIMGLGSISERFTTSLRTHTRQQLQAAGSRTLAKSTDFAARHRIARAHGSYEELVADPEVDIVYVGTPTSMHYDCAMLALEAGKHVLVEKSFAANVQQARAMVEASEARGLFIMEAMWPRFLPFMRIARAAVDSGLIGRPLTLTADLADYNEYDADNYMFSPELGGGVTLDRGIYLASLSSLLIGPTETVAVDGLQDPTGVDAHLNITLGNGQGAYSQLMASMYVNAPSNARLSGTQGSLSFEPPWFLSPRVTMLDSRGVVLDAVDSYLRRDVDAFCYEAAEAARVITAGGISSPLMPARESISIIETLDAILRQAHASWQ
ncbi:Gfo/Idh/MocA family protein [Subtercola endophyticus]|uniref:Gfo/Idh/MocA family protein n=1 Tax=Subtercola endophyticus TaxID=2895559 RepID=UPI001E2C1238|nr:Gfo/Idh/MocA family oxidoreductase [Subtercola endophyticus]UFS59152.1 Gfo/Idh/MocA family oxidoreductase [Subtercola endophyticus]